MCNEVSVLFSEPKIPQYLYRSAAIERAAKFQCSSASRKFLNATLIVDRYWCVVVSVLFSEPKIPQFIPVHGVTESSDSFSALQRAENSSMLHTSGPVARRAKVSVLFSEPKIPQSSVQAVRASMLPMFQCSSASRKFLNP